MTRIAIVGANGQVGAEVCLRLREAEGIEVVPVVRNVSGSAFLRLNGMDCRHGRIADPADASRLIGDCDVVVNFALSTTAIPRVDRDVNRRIVRGILAGAKPGAPIVFASTIMVYAPAMKFRFLDSYGLEKLIVEKMFGRLCRGSHHPFFVFRLGHVMGDLQNITRKMCGEIRGGRVALPHQGRTGSNTVFTATIVEAIVLAARGAQKPGAYDLITSPQWSWQEVYAYYAAQLHVPLELAEVDDVHHPKSRPGGAGGLMRRFLHYLANHHALTERLTFFLAFLPRSINQRMYSRYLQTRARTEINTLRQSGKVELCAPDWRELKVHAMAQLPDPVTLMSRYPLQCTFGYPGADRLQGLGLPTQHLPQ
jgi:nucleoside-diphosphate-sugar epimerase